MEKMRVKRFFKKLLKEEHPPFEKAATEDDLLKKKQIDSSLADTMELFKKIYYVPNNSDVNIRYIEIGGIKKNAAVITISSISNTKLIEELVIRPLLINEDESKEIELLLSPQVRKADVIEDILVEINNGNTTLFVDGEPYAYIISSGNFQGRSVEKAENEVVVKGPKESFNEQAMTNISLIRKRIRDEKLIVESTTISKRAKNELYLVYIKDIANEELITNIKNKLNSLDIDSIQNLSVLEEYLEDHIYSLFPTILYTERPDRASEFIEDGFIVLLMDNSPDSLILPATFWSFFHNSEDHYLRFLFGNFIRILRLMALFITLFISAIYIAITNYHVEMIPADLLLAISSTREIVPFPSLVEILMLEIAFELIREGGLRVPKPIGPTIGIVGALILGQAAVQANLVSPLVVIIVALGGLSSFAIGDTNLNYTVRLLRFPFLISAGVFGLFGLTALFTICLLYVTSIKSFGVPYLAPMTPNDSTAKDTIFRRLVKNELFRPGYLKPKDIEKKAGE
ncbi:spore gernimation protein KA [Ureibacillus manganicus DSM 26584]|uniref:Spore gernimation protein KA n=2 Tax=Ureibacillus TaxID=160795 RepID=A0A0A3ITY4_9BACL|nr:spore gernimation protein KA [Ureibacillus manganicus DSM 26584]